MTNDEFVPINKAANIKGNIVARNVILKIKSQFPTNPQGRLMFAVINTAFFDLYTSPTGGNSMAAKDYLDGDILHAEVCGVNSQWIRDVHNKIAAYFDGVNGVQ